MNHNLKLTIEIGGATNSDISLALDEVRRLIEFGNESGFDKNETGEFNFQIQGLPFEENQLKVALETIYDKHNEELTEEIQNEFYSLCGYEQLYSYRDEEPAMLHLLESLLIKHKFLTEPNMFTLPI